jgi:hypothetical protein
MQQNNRKLQTERNRVLWIRQSQRVSRAGIVKADNETSAVFAALVLQCATQ